MSGSESVDTSTSIPSQLAILVPSFDPSKDDLQVYQQKVQLVLAVWPAGKVSELVTRLILNRFGLCKAAVTPWRVVHQRSKECSQAHRVVRRTLGTDWTGEKVRRRWESFVSVHTEIWRKPWFVFGQGRHHVDKAQDAEAENWWFASIYHFKGIPLI